jgi:hypothetical protein
MGGLTQTHTVVEDYIYPAYAASYEGRLEVYWAWVIVLDSDDWLFIIVIAPQTDYTADFGTETVGRFLGSLEVDGQPILKSAQPTPNATPTQSAVISTTPQAGLQETLIAPVNNETLTRLPLELGTALLERFDNNDNDWRFANLIGGQLIIAADSLDSLRWSFPYPYLDGLPAYYAQVEFQMLSNTDYYQIGMAFRIQDSSNFYLATVYYYGAFVVEKAKDGAYTTLIGPISDPSIKVGQNETNTIGVLVIGDYIEIYLNGTLIDAIWDEDSFIGDARPAVYTYSDANTPATAAFDDYALLPLTINGNPLVVNNYRTVIGRALSGGVDILAGPNQRNNVVASLEDGQLFAALARSSDNRLIYGYARGATGWVPTEQLEFTRAGNSTSVEVLPILDTTAQGIAVQAWPVVWPDESNATTVSPATPTASPDVTLAYGQTVTAEIPDYAEVTWTFAGTAGDVITLGADAGDNTTLDLNITLLDSDLQAVTFDDDSGPGLNPLFEGVTLPTTGVYTVQVMNTRGSGAFTLTLQKTN